jgi:hypothetical protein
MTPILKFLLSLRNLQKSGVIKSVDQAMTLPNNNLVKLMIY